MMLLVLAMLAPQPGPCLPSVRPRVRFDVTREEHERCSRAQERVLQLMSDGNDQAALTLVSSLIQQDPLAFGEDADPVILDYALLALLQKNTGASRDAHHTVRRMFGIPPEPPLFRYNDSDLIASSVAIRFEVALPSWDEEGVLRFLVDMLAAGGQDHDPARAAAMRWMGHALTMENRLTGAKVALLASLEASGRAFGPLSPRRAECLFQLALVEEALCDMTASRQHYVWAIQLALHGCEQQQTDVLHYLEDYGTFLRNIGARKEADFMREIEGSLRLQFFPLH